MYFSKLSIQIAQQQQRGVKYSRCDNDDIGLGLKYLFGFRGRFKSNQDRCRARKFSLESREV